MDSADFYRDLEQLRWQIELGVDECILDTPVDRYALDAKPKPARAAAPIETMSEVDPVDVSRKLAAAAGTLADLRAAMDGYTHCDLKAGARQLVFADGVAGADVMIVGEAPGRDEDREGRPFVGRAGQLLDRMLAAIALDRKTNVYITNVLPWRPPQNRDPKPEEIGMMKPFLDRHIALADPKLLIVMGNISCQALLGKRGITRLRGGWAEVGGRPAMPMFHPAYLLRNPAAKRETWTDLLALQARWRNG